MKLVAPRWNTLQLAGIHSLQCDRNIYVHCHFAPFLLLPLNIALFPHGQFIPDDGHVDRNVEIFS